MTSLLLVAGLAGQALGAPSRIEMAPRAAVSPMMASANVVANVTDISVSRDSCGSALFGSRVLWTCRDTEPYDASTGQSSLPLITNSASWTDQGSSGPSLTTGTTVGAGSTGSNTILNMYGGNPTTLPAFFPVQADQCPTNGVCSDGTRWAVWPNQPPLVTGTDSSGNIVGYTFIPNSHLNGLTSLNPEPSCTLFETSYSSSSSSDDLPTVSIVNENFWAAGQISYGSYGGVVNDGTAYLYGQTDQNKGTTLAKVPAGSITDLSQYQYYVDGAWTSTMPGINDTSAIITNAGAGGQGTFYYSTYYSSYIWIGQAAISVSADFYITTAPAPEGPWITPYLLYSGANGDSGLGGYSLQANPALLPSGDASENAIYLTWTQDFQTSTYGAYVTPLVYLTFQ